MPRQVFFPFLVEIPHGFSGRVGRREKPRRGFGFEPHSVAGFYVETLNPRLSDSRKYASGQPEGCEFAVIYLE